MLFYFTLITFYSIYFEFSVAYLLQAMKKCVPTAIVHGPCHDCVCTIEGVFHCQQRQCNNIDFEQLRGKIDCEGGHLYRDNTVFCSCDNHGYWQSDNCQDKFKFLHSRNSRIHLELRTSVICNPGKLYLVDCNICRCENDGFINVKSCTFRRCFQGHKTDSCQFGEYLRMDKEICRCSDINFYIDRLCIPVDNNSQIQNVRSHDISKLLLIGKSWKHVEDIINSGCNSEILYTVDCNLCVCVDNRLVCTKRVCRPSEIVALRAKNLYETTIPAFESLSELKSFDDPCEPGKSYRYKCNICQCSKEGVLNCATMICLEDYILDENSLRALLGRKQII